MVSRASVVAILFLIVDGALSIPFDVARCRAGCLPDDAAIPMKKSHYYDECWNTCNLLYTSETIICNQSSNCDLGCQLACQFYYKNVPNIYHSWPSSSRKLSPHIPVQLVLTSNLFLDWSHKTQQSSSVVYTILKYNNDSWMTLIQTTKTNCTLQKVNLGDYLKIIAVDQSGVVGEFSVPVRFENLTSLLLLVSWTPSLIYFHNGGGERGAEAMVHWPTFERSKKCEVTWMVMNRNIEITGHLYSEGNTASLTLWTNSAYSIQVKCYDSDQQLYAYSEPMTLDTYGIEAKEKGCSLSFGSISFVLFCSYFFIVGILVPLFMSGGYCIRNRNEKKRATAAPLSHFLANVKNKEKKVADHINSIPTLSISALPSTIECNLVLPCK